MSSLHLKPDPTLSDIQQYVAAMIVERGFDQYSILNESLLLGEEVGELFKVIRKQGANMHLDTNKHYELDAAEEIADVLILLAAIANRLGVDMEQAFRDKEERNKQRVWRKRAD
jgi:NTP pyrophosphatase (non-canonical NTP hydrolase)